MKKLVLFLFLIGTSIAVAQTSVSGKVVDAQGEPLPGANIVEKGTEQGVITDFNGNFQLSLSAEGSILEVAYLGFETQEVSVTGNGFLTVVLNEAAQALDEVTVQGFAGVIGRSRKRVGSIQITPESVTALNAQGIESTGVTDISSFATLVPNLKFNSAQAIGLNFITVRGIPQVRGGDAPLAFVVDGVTLPDPSLLSQELYDLALVEVVKGPQGALYGKNAIGGAVNIYTKDPTNTMSNKFTIGIGNGNSKLGQFISSGAIKKDKIFYRFSAQYKDFDGLLNNALLDTPVDFIEDTNFRGQIKAILSPRMTMTASIQQFNKKGGATYYSVNPTGFEGFPGGILDPDPKEGNNEIWADLLGTSSMKNTFGSIKFDYTLDNVKIQSITSSNKVDRSTYGDLDFIDLSLFIQGEDATTKTFNQEIRINNTKTDTKFDWSLGAFYQQVEKDIYQYGEDGVDAEFGVFEYDVADYVSKINTLAFFGFADYKLSEQLTLSAGFRFDIDSFEQDDVLFETNSDRSNNEFQPKVSLSYQASKNVLLYTNYGKGYRNGGYNAQATDLFDQDFTDETSDNYEIGIKTSSWNDRFILNGSLFSTRMNNQQQYILDLDTFIAGVYNYDESKIFGFEIESRARLTKYLDVLFNYGMADAEIVEGGSAGATNNSAYNGKKVPFVPVNGYGMGLASSFKLSENLSFNGFLNYDTTGKTYWHESNRSIHTTAAYSLLDARIAITSSKGWALSFWGKNLTDQQYYQEFSPGEYVGSPDDVAWRGRPLTIGTSLSFNF